MCPGTHRAAGQLDNVLDIEEGDEVLGMLVPDEPDVWQRSREVRCGAVKLYHFI